MIEPWILFAIFGGVAVLLILFVVFLYNNLVAYRIETGNAWSQINVQLQRRHDLIPNLVESVKGYAKHEQQTFEKVIQARNRQSAPLAWPTRPRPRTSYRAPCAGLLAIAEAYPDLKANQNFLLCRKS